MGRFHSLLRAKRTGFSAKRFAFTAFLLLTLFGYSPKADAEVHLAHIYPAGWNLVSIPAEAANTSPAAVFKNVAVPLRLYDYSGGRLLSARGSEVDAIRPGRAYWLYLEGKTPIQVRANLINPNVQATVRVTPGWNLVATPWSIPTDWSDSSISVHNGTQGLSLSQAVSEGWIEGNLHEFHPDTETYSILPPNGLPLRQMEPWKGYALFSNIEALLCFAPLGPEQQILFGNLMSPLEGDLITAPTAIIGSVVGLNLAQYVLEYAMMGADEFTPFMIGTEQVQSATLGIFDPTALMNGTYTIRLSAADTRGLDASIQINVSVAGRMKTGFMSLAFEDLLVPMPGINLSVTRKYDSRDKRKGDFGYGWTMLMKDAHIERNNPIGIGWQGVGGGMNYCIQPTVGHVVTVTLPDGQIHRFVARLDRDCWQFHPPLAANVQFVALPGSHGTLVPMESAQVAMDWNPGDIVLFDSLYRPFDPERYRYTSKQGYSFIISLFDGLESISDPNGNTLTFTEDGVVHSNGRGIPFERDEEGRIVSITDPEGRKILYEYDERGDLVGVTNRMGDTDRFTYNHRHDILSYVTPSGIPYSRMEYDENGRMIAMIDPQGNRIEYDHDVEGRQEVIRDRFGNPTVVEYDEEGNILVNIDPLGNTEFFTYDTRGNMTSHTDPRGHTSIYTYDSANNRLSERRPDGTTITWTYNSRGQMLTRNGPEGLTEWEYDGRGNLIRNRLPDGSETRWAYNSVGQKTEETDALGGKRSFDYDETGNLIRETDPLGNEIGYTYNVSGLVTSVTRTRTTTDGPVLVVTHREYDAEGRILRETDPEGLVTEYEYNAVGKETARILPGGYRRETEYDSNGNIIRITDPDGRTTEKVFDLENRPLQEVDQAGRLTVHQYDKAGRAIRTEGPGGFVTEKEYDAAGNIVALSLPTGATTEYELDALGRRTIMSHFTGETLHRGFDAAGRVVASTDTLGRVNRYEYDSAGRQTATVLPTGASMETRYDALGRRIGVRDLAGNWTRYAYDPLGRVLSVTECHGMVTSFSYDELGNRLSQTDANGHTTLFAYDNKGRMISRTFPLGMTEYFTYGNCCGHPITHVSFRGEQIQYEYDSMERLLAKRYPDGTVESHTYNSYGSRASVSNPSGTAIYGHDDYGRLVQYRNALGLEASYAYDAMGNVTNIVTPAGETRYVYDSANRISQVVDSTGGITRFEYTLNGRRSNIFRANGVVTRYTYDTLDRLTQVTNSSDEGSVLSSFSYVLDVMGNRIRLEESSGRVVEYSYDITNKLTRETIHDPVSGERVIEYEYDAVGNRLCQTVDGVTTFYSYDANDRLLGESLEVRVGMLPPYREESRRIGTAMGFYRFVLSTGGVLYVLGLICLFVRLLGYAGILLSIPRTRLGSLGVLLLVSPFLVLGPQGAVAAELTAQKHRLLDQPLDRTVTYTYDESGNRISREEAGETILYEYDYENRLTSITRGQLVTRYTYDEDGLLIAEETDGDVTRYFYNKLQAFPCVLFETDGNGVLKAAYTWSADVDPLSVERSGTRHYYLTDGCLNVRQLVDGGGQVTDTWDLDAFGQVLRRTGTTPNRFLLHGQSYDANSGFYYMRARWMDPASGSFTALDPVLGKAEQPITLHKYLFAAGNPVMHSDPWGTQPSLIEVVMVIAIMAGLIAWLLSAVQFLAGAIFNWNRGETIWNGSSLSLSGSGAFAGAGLSLIGVELPTCTLTRDAHKKPVTAEGTLLVLLFGFTLSWPVEFSLTHTKFFLPFLFGPNPDMFGGMAGFVGGGGGILVVGANYGLMTLGFGASTPDSLVSLVIIEPYDPHSPTPHTGGIIIARNLITWQGGFSFPIDSRLKDC